MRLLYVIHQFFPDCYSGTEQHCLAAAREAQRRGHDVTVLSLHWDHDREHPPVKRFEAPYEGLRVIRLNHWRGVNPNDVRRDYQNLHLESWFQEILDDVKPAVVHSFHLRQLGSNLLRVAKRNGLRVVVTLTDFWFLCPRFTLLRPDGAVCDGPPEGGRGCVECAHPELVGVAPEAGAPPLSDAPGARVQALLERKDFQFEHLALADTVVAPSRFLAAMFKKNGFTHPDFRTVPYGMTPSRVERRDVERPRRPLRLAFGGVLSPWKGAHLLIQAVQQTTADVRLDIHGRTDEPMFQEYIDGLRDQAAGDDRVTFRGPYGLDEASDVFEEMDVLVIPSTWYENTPTVMLEAFTAGVPVIASDLGGLAEIVEPGANGTTFRSGDVASLQAAIEAAADDPAWFANLDVRPPKQITETFDEYDSSYRP
ncbi:MAG: glycosyltransferase family 4 protein [Planctomycetota bacterium]|nr:glycosyltransferase family 4 protein [Planctomycetota bacterium]